jgi:hypothetical protein
MSATYTVMKLDYAATYLLVMRTEKLLLPSELFHFYVRPKLINDFMQSRFCFGINMAGRRNLSAVLSEILGWKS